MADNLITLICKKDVTAQEIESFLQSQENISSIINQETEWGFPLCVAVEERKPLDVIQVLINHGANVNQQSMEEYSVPLQAVWSQPVEDCETLCYETVKLLLKNGAEVNGDHQLIRPFIDFLSSENVLEAKIFIPIFRLLLQHADRPTTETALRNLIEDIMYSPIVEEDKLENSMEAVKGMLEAGVSLAAQDWYFTLAQSHIAFFFSKRKSQHVITLFTMTLPYFMLSSSEVSLRESTAWVHHEHCRIIDDLRKKNINNDIHITQLLDSLLLVWDNCAEECNGMRKDLLNHDNTTLQVLRKSRGTEQDSVTSEAAYEVLQRIGSGQYPHFRDIMSLVIKNSNVMDLYLLTCRERFGSVYVIHPDSLYAIKQYLAKEDYLNFLLALHL